MTNELDDSLWYCECCGKGVKEIVRIEESIISDEERKVAEAYFCKECFKDIGETIKGKIREE